MLDVNHDMLIAWAAAVAADMKENSRGEIRISPNKLAAMMARNIPGAPDDTTLHNLHTLTFENKPDAPLMGAYKYYKKHYLSAWLNDIRFSSEHGRIHLIANLPEYFSLSPEHKPDASHHNQVEVLTPVMINIAKATGMLASRFQSWDLFEKWADACVEFASNHPARTPCTDDYLCLIKDKTLLDKKV
ncbi:MAG: hypothetical protein GY774_22925 [Planctomycetes bacterium]|nr:hypothetical protein [Planctomycetota bacterium]